MKTTNKFSMGVGYAAPTVGRIDIRVEQGFATSLDSADDLPGLGFKDYGDEYGDDYEY